MIRKIIHIDEEKCNGCGACATACHEGAIGIVNGKAKLLRDDYCDGFGDCLPACPMDAIHFVEREAAAYDEAAVQANKRKKQAEAMHAAHAGGCPGHQMHRFQREETAQAAAPEAQPSQLGQWPCQIKLVPVNAPYFQGAKLLIAADCTAYAYANMHSEFMKGKITLIGCPKLDAVDYTDKLTEIIRTTTFRASPSCAWRCRAAADSSMRRVRRCARAGSSCRGRSSRSRSTGRSLIAEPVFPALSACAGGAGTKMFIP